MKHRRAIERETLQRLSLVRRVPLGRPLAMAIAPALILAAALAIASYLIATRPQVTAEPPVEREWIVTAVAATPANVRPQHQFFGRIVAGRQVEIRAQVAGRVVEIGSSFAEGAVVREGDLLIRVDPFDYEARLREIEADLLAARAMIEHDREQAAMLRTDVERRERLAGGGAGTQKALEDAKLRLSEAEQRVVDRQNRIARLEIDLDRAQKNLRDTVIAAPFDGFLIDASTAVGKYLGIGDRAAQAIKASSLEARFHVPNHLFNAFLAGGGYKGTEANIAWAGNTYDVVLDRIEGQVDTASAGVELFARLVDVDAATSLRPGAFVQVHVPGRLYENVIQIPEQALHDGDTVYVIVGSRLDARKVALIGRAGSDLLIRGDLEPSDRIVATPFPEIGPGLKVRVQ